jgi:hypothetical protein
MRPSDALTGVEAGQMEMLPPTSVTLRELSGYTSVDEAIGAAGRRVMAAIMPGVERVDGELYFVDMFGPPR